MRHPEKRIQRQGFNDHWIVGIFEVFRESRLVVNAFDDRATSAGRRRPHHRPHDEAVLLWGVLR